MSGHSKWSQIKHKKALTDAKRGKAFSKSARMITVAAREKGGDPETNPKLRLAIDRAKSFNMPQENIERAIKRGTGEIKGMKMEEFLYEAYGPKGIALMIQGITDNKNRTLAEIKNILTRHNGKFAQAGSVSYLFKKLGAIIIRIDEKNAKNKKEELELGAIEAGAEDLKWEKLNNQTYLEIYTKPDNLEKVKNILEGKGATIMSASLDWVPKTEIEVSDKKIKEQIEKLLEALDEQDEVNEIYSNYLI